MSCDKKQLIRDVIKQHFKTEIDEVEISEVTVKGQGYLSKIYKAHSPKTGHNFIIKSAITDPKIREIGLIEPLVVREAYFYKSLLPIFENLQAEYNITDKFCEYPLCYEVRDETFVMEDLRLNNFSIADKEVLLTEKHIEAGFRMFAKFHALSYALQYHKPDVWKSIQNSTFDIITPDIEFYDLMILGNQLKIREFKKLSAFPKYIEKVEEISLGVRDFFQFMSTNRGKFPVLTHGDAWINNLFFRNNKNSNSYDVKLIDYQNLAIDSPVKDLSFFFYCGVESPDILKNLENYLRRFYYEPLMTLLREFHVEKNMSFNSLLAEWSDYATYGYLHSTLIHHALLSDMDEIRDFDDVTGEHDDKENFFPRLKKHDKYIQRLINITEHFIKQKGL